ncbi:hypothetical protein [Hyphomicrobium sp.]|uniref:hypothetical protein n=1 Tax=Hyphomicrobium sp. TaxID=82 RepID=UPI001D1EF9FF|nr:hypothetical protein [Hyphomicrobium sp.]MBY0558379.1 hypothetical protein [Hyphomicrobium sp.]
MFQAASVSIKSFGMAALAVLAVLAVAAGDASADPCADSCRSQHNSCRMAAKLLYSAHCDAQLQSCITQCFSGARSRDRDNRSPRDIPRGMSEPRGVGGGMGEPRDMRGPPTREFHDPRDQGGGQRWPGDRR